MATHDPRTDRAEATVEPGWTPAPPRWGLGDLLALLAWTGAIVAFFWDVVALRGALFYFDITEINLPYRDFFALELKAGRFSRWMPGLYCGMPLYSESQAGYLHPLKYLLYPWMETWKAFGLDTVLSVWLTGLGTYGWLRRRVGAIGGLTGAAVFGLSGFVWAHLIHTSMINALVSVPLAFWALECAWDGGRLRGIALGGAAMACQVFAGHLQDFLLTGLAVGLYGLYRAATERGLRPRLTAIGGASGVVLLGVLLAAVQWLPSKELLDRSPRSEGLTWEELTYGSWSPELLPTLILRETYGTRARDTDWMDGFYPYHEMNAYMGAVAIALAVIGLAGRRDRWAAFWPILATAGGLLMLGRFTALMDHAHEIPVLGSSRIPVRFHLWVSLAVAALAAVGADHLARPGPVRLRGALLALALIVLGSIPFLLQVYEPIYRGPERWPLAYHQDRYRWLGRELIRSGIRTSALTALGIGFVAGASKSSGRIRAVLAAGLPLVVIADLLGAHWDDIPTIDPSYWTEAPASAELIGAAPGHDRVLGTGRFSAGEPGYASVAIDFKTARDTLAWSLPPVFGLRSALGETPMVPTRWKRYMDATDGTEARLAIAGVTHLLHGFPGVIEGWPEPVEAGSAFVHTNPRPLPRARLMGRPVYAKSEAEAVAALARLGDELFDRLVIEDPDRPLPEDADPLGTAEIVEDFPERLLIRTSCVTPAYLVIADTYDPGWRGEIDGKPASIRPAYVNFRGIYVPPGDHRVVLRYRPAMFGTGLAVTAVGSALALAMLVIGRPVLRLGPSSGPNGWSPQWPWALAIAAVLIVGGSAFTINDEGLQVSPRWLGATHRFTWGAGLEAMRRAPSAVGERP